MQPQHSTGKTGISPASTFILSGTMRTDANPDIGNDKLDTTNTRAIDSHTYLIENGK